MIIVNLMIDNKSKSRLLRKLFTSNCTNLIQCFKYFALSLNKFSVSEQ